MTLSEEDLQRMKQQRFALVRPLIEKIVAFGRPSTFYRVNEIPAISPLVRQQAASFAWVIAEFGLTQTQDGSTVVMPTVVPTGGGAIQFEWHRKGIDLEIEVHPSGEISAYVEQPNAHPIRHPSLSSSLQPVEVVLKTVLQR